MTDEDVVLWLKGKTQESLDQMLWTGLTPLKREGLKKLQCFECGRPILKCICTLLDFFPDDY